MLYPKHSHLIRHCISPERRLPCLGDTSTPPYCAAVLFQGLLSGISDIEKSGKGKIASYEATHPARPGHTLETAGRHDCLRDREVWHPGRSDVGDGMTVINKP